MATDVRVQEIEHEIGETGRFGLRITDGEVELRATDGPWARVRASFELRAGSEQEADELFERVQLRAVRSDGGLEIEEPRDGPAGGLGAIARLLRVSPGQVTESRIQAEVPRHAEVRVSGVSASVTVSGLRGTQHYRSVSGDLVLTGLGGELRLQSVSGDASIRADERLDLDARTVSGDLSVLAPEFAAVRVNTVSGDVELEGDLGRRASHRVDTVSGDLLLGITGGLVLEVRGLSSEVDVALPHRSEGSRDRRRYVVGGGGASLLFSSMSGDVDVRAAHRVGPRHVDAAAAAPTSPVSPAAAPPSGADDAAETDAAVALDELEILRAVERGEMTVDEAARRLGKG